MVSRSDLVEHLRGLELFSDVSKADLRRVAAVAEERVVPAGETLIEQGAVGRTAYLVLEGEATIRRGTRTVNTVGPGAMVGELALLDKGPRSAYVIARTDLLVAEIHARDFGRVLDEVPALTRKLLASLASRVRALDRAAYG